MFHSARNCFSIFIFPYLHKIERSNSFFLSRLDISDCDVYKIKNRVTKKKARGKAESFVDREAGSVFVIVFPAETFVSG